MDGMTVVWIVVAVVVVLVLVALIAGAAKKSKQRRVEHDRQEAYDQQQQADAIDPDLRSVVDEGIEEAPATGRTDDPRVDGRSDNDRSPHSASWGTSGDQQATGR